MDPIFYRLFEKEPKKWNLKRLQMLESCITLIFQNGVENLSLDLLAKKTKTTRSHVVYYFKSREKLLFEVITFIVKVAQTITEDRVNSAKNSEEKLRAMISSVFEWGKSHPEHMSLFCLFYYYATYDPKWRSLHTQVRAVGKQRIVAILSERFPKSNIRGLELCAEEIQSVITGFVISAFSIDSKISLNDQEQQCWSVLKQTTARLLG